MGLGEARVSGTRNIRRGSITGEQVLNAALHPFATEARGESPLASVTVKWRAAFKPFSFIMPSLLMFIVQH